MAMTWGLTNHDLDHGWYFETHAVCMPQEAPDISTMPPKKRRWGPDYKHAPAKPQPAPAADISAQAAPSEAAVRPSFCC